ncbi:ubiquitin thioesterase ZRANB1 [Excalfactoria chinensis]|uniref:ubiquitinyl hydrolase 1 n=2 Tax=Neognathae TaxID=8825 RepID=A0A1D5PDU1_CHICK|nr:ubiquitin thioesterase ZRANB1 [Gallus gallus]XP_015144546.1 ubiquitin thioesterase ZRANB1 [Gallus gallus]XP_015722994.1 ubiquitin thioesterase ZRANB1 [Coturnix japonica]XP_015722995.1 ubiquitin thioesterase ZRANB1 [Coturnix japonica]XP_015722996.1 ubiquitin thioesterase ZRANB1 [Coturnix japonica]XP_040530410.1 ubiquitin thioesterase ZRANB1 [Gallus gallus]XP_040530411.1 ubiquitin thioesterase ZRANB1 [Gallus gallus]XP_046776611.1 ubiquitin thioesterase ZRANB1 [Gallus gallus]XP_046799128.1 |eukprot:XP_015144544.1 ubiquitin thioesterase ZRANB1 [Gallus gallus]
MTERGIKWACEYCTYENWPSAIKCTMCRAQRPSGTIITEDPFKSGSSDIGRDWDPTSTEGGSSPLICPDSSARPRVKSSYSMESANKWSCHMCTYLNWPRAIRCTQCLSQRRTRSPTESPQSSGSGSRPVPFSVDPCEEYNDRNKLNTRAQHWTCSVCTYENWAKARKCVVCDHPRPNNIEAIELADTEEASSIINEQDRARWRGSCSSGNSQRRSPPTTKRESDVKMDFQRIELAGAVGSKEELEVDFKKLKQIKNRMKKTDWLFLNACVGVVEGDLAAVEAYKSSGGDIARQLSADEVRLLNRPSAFDVGYTLVHLAIRFQRQDMLAILLTEVSQHAAKCIPAMVCPEVTEQIRREIAASLHQRKGDFACYFLTDLVTFTLPADIEDLPPTVQEKLFDEVLDRDVQKELEEESPIINWSLELGTRLDSRLYALWNRTAGDCLLDSVLQATWGIYDKDSVLRKALHDSLHDCSHWFYTRWKEWESWYSQSFGLHFSLREEQWQEDWAFILSLASQPGASLEQTHIFVLAHILRRPIIVYGVKYYKSFRGETLGYTRFQGVYLPLLWEQSFCWKSPIALGYTRGHFSALVAMENDGYGNRGAGANLNTDDDVTVTFLPLVDSERKLLHIHFLSAQEIGNEEQQEKLLREWLDCCVTEGGVLVAMQKSSRRRNHPLVTQMVEKWLDRYRQIRPCTSLSDGEEDEDDDDE